MLEFQDKLLMFNPEDLDFEFVMINPDNQEVYSIKNDEKYQEKIKKLQEFFIDKK